MNTYSNDQNVHEFETLECFHFSQEFSPYGGGLNVDDNNLLHTNTVVLVFNHMAFYFVFSGQLYILSFFE